VATGVAAILVDQAGENVIAVAGGANQALGADGVRRALGRLALAQDDVVLVSNEVPTEAVRAALDAARGVGARSILNPAPADGIDRAILALADVATPNRSEVVALLRSLHEATDGGAEGPPAPADAASLLASVEGSEATGSAILVTLGPNGALLVTRGPGGTVREHPVAAPGVVAVDATGAGDAFNGCLAASLADGSSLETAAARAVVAGALATTAVGARTAMPRRAALEESVAAFAGGGAIARTQPTT
jgi:ribokinase